MSQRFPDVNATFVDQFSELHRVGYRAAFAVLGRRADAEDCTQEALARALVRWNRVHSYAPAWIARVTTNLALDRTRQTNKTASPGDSTLADAADRHDPVADRRRDLVTAMRALPKRQREAVALRYLADLPENQTASAMGCSIGAVKRHTAKGLQRLRLDLGPRWAWED
jgi:RNA polymerase sigma factor (sigma-70 family)